jgi:hypothetical protein
MIDPQHLAELEALARMAARAAGRDPDERVRICLGAAIPFDDVMWRYPDFIARAEAAYAILTRTAPPQCLTTLDTKSGNAGSISPWQGPSGDDDPGGVNAGSDREPCENGGARSRLRSGSRPDESD